MKVIEYYDLIESREDFVRFVEALRTDLLEDPASWENENLSDFLEALASWVQDMDGYYRNQDKPLPNPDWKAIADMLMGAKVYE